jgi:Ca-activated chloride channel family protein
MDAKTFKIDELAQLTDLPIRTIRYYIQLELLERPVGEGRAAHYTTGHLERLLEVKKLSNAGLSLEYIREILHGEEPPLPPRLRTPGMVEVRSHIFLAPGVELQINPAEASWPPEKIRALTHEVMSIVQKIFKEGTVTMITMPHPPFVFPFPNPFKKGARTNMKKKSLAESLASPLKGVDMTGHVNGLMLSLSQRQRYVNDSKDNYEFVYTFPLPYGAALLDLRVTLAGKELVGQVIGRQKAEKDYEEAIDAGDAPIMVNQSADGLFTANIGNIKPGEEVLVEIRYAQLLRFEQGHLSLRLPTVIGPRYGDAHAQGGLAPHETDRVDLAADYPLTLMLKVEGELKKARLSSPSHQIRCQADGDSLTVTLPPEARLDRDVVINFDDLTGRSFALKGADDNLEVVLASFCPELTTETGSAPAPLSLKILVDCSGSMGGDSIAGAKGALKRILNSLGPQDKISYSRFGSKVTHDLQLTACGPSALAALEKLIATTEADMGGTAMDAALTSTFKDIGGPEDRADVLLITDGDIWDTANVVKSAQKSGQRVFAIGVGSAPAESLLRAMAEETGGACEFITPSDDFDAAIRRQVNRMRDQKAAEIAIDWGAEPVWASLAPKCLYAGETLHLFAAFERPLQRPPRLTWNLNGQPCSVAADEITACGSPDLRRLGGHQRLKTAGQDDVLNLALQYQLVSPQSSLFLIQVREEGEKAQGLPKLRQAEQMMAAGWGGLGSVRVQDSYVGASLLCMNAIMPTKAPRFLFSKKTADKSMCCSMNAEALESQPLGYDSSAISPRDLLSAFDSQALNSTDFSAITRHLANEQPGLEWSSAMNDLVKNEGLDMETAWAVMLLWLAEALANDLALSRQAQRLLCRALSALDDARQKSLRSTVASHFPTLTAESWA